MPVGTIKKWVADRGFGFISDDTNPSDKWNFVHVSAFPNSQPPELGEAYSYAMTEGTGDRMKAVGLELLVSAEVAEVDRCMGADWDG